MIGQNNIVHRDVDGRYHPIAVVSCALEQAGSKARLAVTG